MTGLELLAVRSGLPRDATTGALVEPENPHLALNEATKPRHPEAHISIRAQQPQRRKPRLIAVTLVNDIQTEMANILDNCENTVKVVWIETPSNPTLWLADIQAVADIAHERGSLLVVDNTFLSPYIQNPLRYGADVVLHSVTKYINGYSDVLMGAIALQDPTIYKNLAFIQNAAGSVPGPFDCWLAHRGVKPLHLRSLPASQNASTIAQILAASPHVLAVNHPGLSTHPQSSWWAWWRDDFLIRGGSEAARRFCESSRLFTLAESLSGVERLCEVPAAMTHCGMAKEVPEESDIYENLIRLSVGVEDVEDLKVDLVWGLEEAVAIELGRS
ncbi:hypothetical protein AARAC_003467 [Aspergillus arachidicola]|uniref:cystathionine gamma-lyase n=1 Tax=Aspergillus arachidicola TaxID=656916 RepID=A0A2G7FM15_9EURO|nr:hypothetical protein AARAC_003467 [Aspergillus arachidicola]